MFIKADSFVSDELYNFPNAILLSDVAYTHGRMKHQRIMLRAYITWGCVSDKDLIDIIYHSADGGPLYADENIRKMRRGLRKKFRPGWKLNKVRLGVYELVGPKKEEPPDTFLCQGAGTYSWSERIIPRY